MLMRDLGVGGPLGASMQARSCCSSIMHCCAARCGPADAQQPSTVFITPMHGLGSVLFGRRTFSARIGGRRTVDAIEFVPPRGGIVADWIRMG